MYNIWELCQGICEDMAILSNGMLNLMTETWELPGGSFPVGNVLFGTGMIALIAWKLVKFLLPT